MILALHGHTYSHSVNLYDIMFCQTGDTHSRLQQQVQAGTIVLRIKHLYSFGEGLEQARLGIRMVGMILSTDYVALPGISGIQPCREVDFSTHYGLSWGSL